jgi:integrase
MAMWRPGAYSGGLLICPAQAVQAEATAIPRGAVAGAGIRRFPPRIMRHTAASWLVQDGVPLYDVQHLLGHEDCSTTQRYAHLAPDAQSKVMESWARRLDAPVTHGRKETRPS